MNSFRPLARKSLPALPLALAALPSAHGQIVYTNPSDLSATNTPATRVFFNFNGDGTGAATGTATFSGADFQFYGAFNFVALQGINGINTSFGILRTGTVASNLAAGTVIGSGSSFTANSFAYVNKTAGTYNSTWPSGGSGYIGINFLTGGSTYYGWIGLTYSSASSGTVTLTDFAYNSTPGASIMAGQGAAIPEPAVTAAALAAILAGSAALYRRRSRKNSAPAAA